MSVLVAAVVPAAAGAAEIASDPFSRTVGNGWGTAPTGGPWTVGGSASAFGVAGGVGTIAVPSAGATREVRLTGASGLDVDVRATVRTDKVATGTAQYAYLTARRQASGAEYRAMVMLLPSGQVRIGALRFSGTESNIGSAVLVPGLTRTPSTALAVRTQVTGRNPTTLRMRVWPTTEPEPSTWQLSVTDATSGLQAAGSIGVRAYLASSTTNAPVTFSVDDLTAQDLGPSVTSFTVAPTAPQPGQPITGTAVVAADGPFDYAWLWRLNGVTIEAPASASTTGGTFTQEVDLDTEPGDVVELWFGIVVGGDYVWSKQQVTVAAPAPVVTSFAVAPTSPQPGETITGTAVVTASGPFEYAWLWRLNGVTLEAPASASQTGGTFTQEVDLDTVPGDVVELWFGPYTGGAYQWSKQQVTVADGPLPPTVFAEDQFTRVVASGWGSAATGGAYTLAGNAGFFAVNGGKGAILLDAAGANRAASLATVSQSDVQVELTVERDKAPVGGQQYVYGVLRRINASNEYRAKLRFAPNGSVYAQATAVIGNVETAVGPEVPVPASTSAGVFHLQAQVVGTSPATLRIRAWNAADAQPGGWQFTGTSTAAALQAPGGVGLRAYLGSGTSNAPVTVRFDAFRATSIPTP